MACIHRTSQAGFECGPCTSVCNYDHTYYTGIHLHSREMDTIFCRPNIRCLVTYLNLGELRRTRMVEDIPRLGGMN